ncbi:MAG: hypothetical protein JW747_01565 [Candidatus Aminicenantes bacterium]|nr:hypothetical protein [Candidatus Aminicenantes bacterium]
MDNRPTDRSRYFRDASRAFLKLRGAPFILSARELHVLASWEKEGIPLASVLEGLEAAFRRPASGALPGRAKASLVSCDAFVRKAYDRHRERAVGRRPPSEGRPGRKERIRREAAAFLEDAPAEPPGLKDLFLRAVRLAENEDGREADFARLEEEIEELLLKHGPDEERRKAERQVRREAPSASGMELENMVRARLLKNLRVRYRVPFVSYPYF